MKLRITRRAHRRIKHEDDWWRENRPHAPDKLKLGLQRTYERILKAPKLTAPWGYEKGEPVWRIAVKETPHHVFYTVDDEAGEATIEYVHGAFQQPPKRVR